MPNFPVALQHAMQQQLQILHAFAVDGDWQDEFTEVLHNKIVKNLLLKNFLYESQRYPI